MWSRDPAVGLFAVLPLWLCYEILRLTLAPAERNGAEAMVSDLLRLLGHSALVVLRVSFAVVVLAAARSIHRRDLPWVRVGMVVALEGTVYALILGPLAGVMASSSLTMTTALGPPPGRAFVTDLVGSLGAGIFEELVFRLCGLSLLALLSIRAVAVFGLPRVTGVAVAVVLSGVVFALFHHVGPGAHVFDAQAFAFRTMAGVLLGALFVTRGFGVCVWAHAMYDVHYYLTH
jgi:hypothetical protein